jgi:hypothetical protein
MKATLLVDRSLVVRSGRYVVVIKVYEVQPSEKYPQGIKARYLLQDMSTGRLRLLLDNHEPFGFHMHTRMPHEESFRMAVEATDYLEAYEVFMNEVERILTNEES